MSPRHALGEPFFIHFFDGAIDCEPNDWSFQRNLVGTQTVFVERNATILGQGVIVRAQVPLTPRLVEMWQQGAIPSLEPIDIVPYLTENLEWRVQKVSVLLRSFEKARLLHIVDISC
jgi:Tyosinase C-terminal domain